MSFITEKEKQTPVVGEYDVLVCGGGFGGIAAALAAAREGKKVLLCEREFALGGLGTLGLVTIYLPLCDGFGKQVSFSIAEELLRLSIKRGADTHKHPAPTCWLEGTGTKEERTKQRYRVQYNPWYFVSDVEQLLKAEGVTILYGTAVDDVVVENHKIRYVITHSINGREAVKVKAVVDASGSAVVCKLAGEDTAVYPAGNVPSSWYYYASKEGNRLKMFGPADYQGAVLDGALQGVHFSGLDALENSEMLMYSREKMLDDIEKLKVTKEDPSIEPIMISTIQELRMTRRIVGVEDFLYANVEKPVESSIGCIGNWHKCGGGHEIPYGSLFGKKIKNLITAGRITSTDDAGWDLTRVIPACSVTGEAAGVAAAMTDDFAALDVSLLQNKLREKGVLIHLDEAKD
ncbi:MAG: FAD-dependent oxidoreductase [Clostridia bacterium]|nr:FAD-dependent oxidoreductase [Clostridia bacterium]